LITGRVVDAGTLVGLPGVDVRLLGASTGVTTNDAGETLDTLRIAGKSELVAVPRLAGFEMRRQLNRGTFITPEQSSTPDRHRSAMSFARFRDQGQHRPIRCARCRIDARNATRPLRQASTVPSAREVDGFLMPLDDTPLPVTSPKALHGIEIYSGPATIPRELIRGGEDVVCGLVAIWTK
jgi:hypothetical protein